MPYFFSSFLSIFWCEKNSHKFLSNFFANANSVIQVKNIYRGSSMNRTLIIGMLTFYSQVKNSMINVILEKNLIIGILIDKSQYLRLISVLKWTWNSQYHNFLILLEAIILIIEEPLYYQTTLREHTLAFRGKSFYAVIIILW